MELYITLLILHGPFYVVFLIINFLINLCAGNKFTRKKLDGLNK